MSSTLTILPSAPPSPPSGCPSRSFPPGTAGSELQRRKNGAMATRTVSSINSPMTPSSWAPVCLKSGYELTSSSETTGPPSPPPPSPLPPQPTTKSTPNSSKAFGRGYTSQSFPCHNSNYYMGMSSEQCASIPGNELSVREQQPQTPQRRWHRSCPK